MALRPSMCRSTGRWLWGNRAHLQTFAFAREVRETYFVEVNFGYADEAIVRSLRRKYGQPGDVVSQAARVVLVVDRIGRVDWDGMVRAAAAALGSGLKLEVWDEVRFAALLRTCFDVELGEVAAERLIDVRRAIDHAKGFRAFGGESPESYEHDALKAQLLWHFGFWRLRQIREPHQLDVRDIVAPGTIATWSSCSRTCALFRALCATRRTVKSFARI